ncbi:dTDP-D-glucose 4,6-dehydratase-like [Rhincodon typus]|uniref:dTDP-D-glucose 4,6-dehydratase-like n=1 Tax=Rhincodon typus TaxID=259920 RepID=UPI00202EB0A7|nr:dTDP-D-glucose 4,6-dehydratase-like [Rhincodon typus]
MVYLQAELSLVTSEVSLKTYIMIWKRARSPGLMWSVYNSRKAAERMCEVIICLQERYPDCLIVNLGKCSLEFTNVNIYGTEVLVKAAYQANVEKFIHVSTDEVYEGSIKEEFNEASPKHPSKPYAASKAASEYIAMSYLESFKIPVVVTRSNVYGSHQYCESNGNQSAVVLRRHRDKPQPVGYYSGKMDPVMMGQHLCVRAIKRATWALMTFSPLIRLGKVKGTASESKLELWLEHVSDRPSNYLGYPMDSTKLYRLGWKPKVAWEEEIRKTSMVIL